MKHLITASLLLLLLACQPATRPVDYTHYVNPNIGTAHSRWFFYTPAAVPFGMAKPAPSTDGHYGNKSGWEAVGYDPRHTSIEGFANFHEFQVGGIVCAPTTGTLQTVPGSLEQVNSGYRSNFDKADEHATSGYYSVLLKDYGIKAELTATKRVAFHRYTYPVNEQAHLIFDVGHQQGESGKVKDAFVKINPDGSIEGWVITLPEYVKKYQAGADLSMYFYAVVDRKPVAYGTFTGEQQIAGNTEVKGEGAGVYLTFEPKKSETVGIKMGLSYTSVANAKLNLEREAAQLDFDQACEAAKNTWNDYLGRIAVETTNENDKVKFYTALYHALLGRGLASDVNGAYPKNDGTVGQIALDEKGEPVHHHYNTDAIWGAFWNLTQLWSVAYPEYLQDWIQSQLLVYKDAGWLGDGIACSKYVSGVGTNFVSLVCAAAYNCGLQNFDTELAYEASLKNELQWQDRPAGAGKMDLKAFVERGFIPYDESFHWVDYPDGSYFGVSHSLEYCFSSYAVAQWAKKMNRTADYEQLMQLSENWKKSYDSETRFIRPRRLNGEFIEKFNPQDAWRGFQEGNAWQYTFYVPHQPEELATTLGRDLFNSRLDSIFTRSQASIFGGGAEVSAFAGVEALYNQGNQPCLHMPWLFNFSGKPELTQKWTRAICNEFYGTDPVHGYGFGQDEDQGQLGAWYVMASMGLFDVKGLCEQEPTLQYGSPLFDKVTIQVPDSKPFVIRTVNNGPNSSYVQSVRLNGKELAGVHVPFAAIRQGEELVLEMGDRIPVN